MQSCSWTFRVQAKALLRGSILVLVGGALSGCGSLGGAAGPPTAQVRFVQVAPATGTLDALVDGAGAAYGLGYETFTSYVPVPAGSAQVQVHTSGSAVEVLATHETLAAGRPYTVVLSHGLGSLQEHTYPDQDSIAPAGTVQLRIINAVEAGGPLALYITSAAAPDAPAVRVLTLPEGEASAYLDVPAGPAYLITAATAGGAVSHKLKAVSVKAVSGAVRTIIFAGISRSGAHPVVGFTLADADAE